MSRAPEVQAEVKLDFNRAQRIGVEEAIFAGGKSVAQIEFILDAAALRGASLLLTRLGAAKADALPQRLRERLDYCDVSATAYFGPPHPLDPLARVALVVAGTSDMPTAREAQRTLAYHGHACTLFADVGVAGLWRLTNCLDALRTFPILIAVAGMDAALPTVLGGLVGGAIVAVPTSVGYGVAAGGRAALDAILASCSPGITVVNIDNGYGAACAAMRVLGAMRMGAAQAVPADLNPVKEWT